MDATNFIKTVEQHQHRKIACLEEIAYLNGWISKEEVLKVYEVLKKNQYVSSGFMEIFRKLYWKRQSGYSHMLNDATCFKKIFIVTGYTDLRSGIDRLADTVCSYLGGNAIEPDTLYLFCGRRTDRIKGLVWENDGSCFIKD